MQTEKIKRTLYAEMMAETMTFKINMKELVVISEGLAKFYH